MSANTAPACRRALAPSDNSVDSKCNFLTPEKYHQNGKSVYFCVRKLISVRIGIYFTQKFTEPTELFLRNEQNMCYHTGIRIHRTCRRLRHDGWRGENENGRLSHHHTQNANPQTLAITGVSADCLYCAERMRRGLKSSPSRSCCRTSLPRWCRSAGRCISWLCRRWQRHGPPPCRQWCKPPLRYSVLHR